MSQNQHELANDGSAAPRPENAHGTGSQQQGQKPQTQPKGSSEGHHGGNHGNDINDEGQPAYSAKGSSHEGHDLDAQDRNSTGGGSKREHANQTQNTTAYNTEYGEGNAAPSSANDGGKIGDANNPV